jgi:hypothetical protein
MNKLNPEDLHLLIDEPIYLLKEQVVQQEEIKEDTKVEEPKVELEKPASIKDILVIVSNNISPDDEIFLFKGLNALDITKDDISILDAFTPADEDSRFSHSKEIHFSENPDSEKVYRVIEISGLSKLACQPLNIIRNDKDLKVKFWLALKSLFGK